MRVGKKYSRGTIAMAVINGVFIGVAAVVIIGLLLTATNAKVADSKGPKEIPTSGPSVDEKPIASDGEQSIKLFAKQHGAFSTVEAASTFIAQDPALVKAATIQVVDQYYVWSAVAINPLEIEVSEDEGTYRKEFLADSSACASAGIGGLNEVLKETEVAKIKMLATQNTDEKKGDGKDKSVEFIKNITAITAFTDDLKIIRLHLLSQYTHTDKCVKISF